MDPVAEDKVRTKIGAPVLSVENLRKYYEVSANALFSSAKKRVVKANESISFQAHEAETLAIVGESGCGKSTLLRLIAGLEDITAGHIEIDGKDATDVVPAKRGLAMVFQSYALYPAMTVKKNVTFGLEQRKTPKEKIENEQIPLIGFGTEETNEVQRTNLGKRNANFIQEEQLQGVFSG